MFCKNCKKFALVRLKFNYSYLGDLSLGSAGFEGFNVLGEWSIFILVYWEDRLCRMIRGFAVLS